MTLIYDYALEPELIAKCPPSLWRYLNIEKNFSWDAGFVVVLYPDDWKTRIEKLVKDSRQLDLLLELIKTWPQVVRPTSSWHHNTWLENAEEENFYPFHAILALNPGRKTNVASVKDIDSKAGLWRSNPPPSITVDRTAASMAACVKPMLRYAKRIRFIDPHFCPLYDRFKAPLREFLSIICYGKSGDKVTLEYHVKANGDWNTFKNDCQAHLPCLIPTDFKITICRWKNKNGGEHFHNRYILTDIGGVSFGNSISQQPKGTDTICRLSSNDCLRWISKFSGHTPAFDPGDPPETVTISGELSPACNA